MGHAAAGTGAASAERGILAGVRVLDFGHYVAGPLLAVMLADQGADVIHVDRPQARLTDADAYLNRGKRRITLDLTQPSDAATAVRLAERADILIENFRPGVMARHGLGWDHLAGSAPRLIYCSLPGFSADDPRAGVPAWEGVVSAAAGNCFLRVGQEPEGWDVTRPVYSPVPLASTFAAFTAATAVVAALTFRHRTGEGQRVEVPLYHAMFELIGKAGAFPEATGFRPAQPHRGNGSGTYKCADGRYIRFDPIGSSARFLRWVLDAAGEYSWAADDLTDGARLAGDLELEKKLCERLRELFRTRTAAEWEELGGNAGAPLAFIRSGAEWLASAHARMARAVVQVADPLLGMTWMAGLPVSTAASAHWAPQPRRLPGADREAVLAESLQPRQEAVQPSGGAPGPGAFSGLRVLDLTEILAGPSSGRILGEYGAGVIKINAPHSAVTAHGMVNRGKRSILLDIERDQGQTVFWRLMDRSDVIIVNYPEGTAARYGISYPHVRARRPDAVYVSVTCYGEGGQWGARRGYETQGQAVTGLMERAGGDHIPKVQGPYNVVDFGTGVMAAFAAALGIYHRTVTGTGCHLTTSLAQTATYHQAVLLLSYEGKQHAGPRGPQALGEGPCQRYYQAADGWFFLGAGQGQLPLLRAVASLAGQDGAGATGQQLEQELAASFATRPVAEWVARLQGAGIGAHEVLTTEQVMADPRARNLSLSVTQVSEEAGPVIMPGLTARLSRSPLRLGPPARRPGADAARVLAGIGLAGEAEALQRRWVLRVTDLPAGW